MKSKTPFRIAMLLAFVALTIGTAATAQDEKKKKRQGQRQGRGGLNQQIMSRYKNIEFSDEQKAKIKEITKKHAAKVAEIRKASNELLTAEQRKVRSEVLRKARQDGKKFAEAVIEANKKAGLSEELIGKLKESQSKIQAITKEITEAVNAILTDEQKATIRKSRKRNAGPKGKKDGKAKATGQVVNLKLPNMT